MRKYVFFKYIFLECPVNLNELFKRKKEGSRVFREY
jgi:hypothetical protein